MIYLFGILHMALASQPKAGTTHRAGVVEALFSAGAQTLVDRIDLVETRSGWLICGPSEADEIPPRRRHMLAHARVLEACQAFGAVLPMRFGMCVPDMTELLAQIDAGHARLAENFAAIEGRAEFALRISFDRAAALEATLAATPALAAEHARLSAMPAPPQFALAEFGRSLSERLERRRLAAQSACLASLRSALCDHVLAAPRSDVEILHLHALVAPDQAEALATAALAAAEASGFAPGHEPDLRVIGPSPPFNFVSFSLAAPHPEAA